MNKQIKPTSEMINAALEVVKCMAHTKSIKSHVTKIKTDLLLEVSAIDEEGNAITEDSKAYLMCEKSAEKYYALFDQRIKEGGYNVPEGVCPLLMAENNERKAKRKMNELAQALVPEKLRVDISSIWKLEDLQKLTDLNLKYILQFA